MPTPLEKLTTDWQTNYSDMPLSDFVTKVHGKLYSDIPFSDFTDKLGLTVPPDPIKQEPSPISPVEGASPWEAGQVPSRQEMAPYARPMIEAGGQIAGGAAGSLLAPGPGTIAGETAGYVGSSYLGDLLLGDSNRSLAQRAGEGAAFSVIPFGIGKGLQKLGRGAVRSALKIPPTQVSREGAEKVVDTVIKENLRVGEGGVRKAQGIIREMESDMNAALKSSGGKIQVDDIVNVIEAQKPRFANTDDPQAAYEILDGIAEKLRTHPNVVNGAIPIEKAQLMKKELYKKMDGFYRNLSQLEPVKAEAGRVASVGFASEAEGLRKAILDDPTIPKEAADWLKREGNVVNALRWIKRRANVGANMDPITFNDVLLGGLIREGVPAAIAVRIFRSPAILSQAGIGMVKGGPMAGKALRTGATLAYPRENLLSQ